MTTCKARNWFRIFLCAQALVCFGLYEFSAGTAFAQEPIIYPARGQSPEQMEKDKFECYTWAKKQTGFDPMQAQQAPAPSSQGYTGEVARGAAGGAAGGAIIGAISGDAGKGAAIGAAGGAMIGGIRKRQRREQEQQAQQQEAATIAAGRNDYNRALGACLEGRGYTLK